MRELVQKEITVEGPRRHGGADQAGSHHAGPSAPARKARRTVTVNIAESPLSWLHAHGHLDDRLFQAGEKLRSDFERAQISPSITMRWHAVRIGGGAGDGLTETERQIAARARFNDAVKAAGNGLQDILWRVVCHGEALAVAEKALAWPSRSGKLVLKLALDRVADFYRIN